MNPEQILDAVKGVEVKINAAAARGGEQMRELAERVLQLEQGGTRKADPLERGGVSKSLADLFAEGMAPNAEIFKKTGSLRFETKAAGDPILTTSVGAIHTLPGIAVPGPFAFGLQSVLASVGSQGGTQAKYTRYTGIEGAAGVQATEGAAKEPITPTFSQITQDAITIAGYCKASEQALNDRSELDATINAVLARSLQISLDDVLVDGSVAPAFSGFEALATAYTSLVYTGLVDAASEGVSDMQQAGFVPTVAVMSPADWLAVVTAKASGTGEYLSGSYLGALPENMRGLRVGVSTNVAAGKVLLLDPAFCQWFMVQGMTFAVDRINDDFTKNLVTIRGELRIIPVFRATGSARLITPKP